VQSQSPLWASVGDGFGDLLDSRHAPDHVSHVVGYQQSAIPPDRHPDRSTIGLPFVGREESLRKMSRGGPDGRPLSKGTKITL
jgi:hypothetical protein